VGLFLVVDPGIRFAGISVIDEQSQIKHSETLKFNTKKSQQIRIFELYKRMQDIVEQFGGRDNIEAVITEYQFVAQMSWIVGCLMTFAGSIEAELIKLTPSQWKKMATGKGNISEEQLREKVLSIYPECSDYSEHQIDTLGMFLAYINQEKPNVESVKKPNKRKNTSKN
jgi:Holliday junction resolvasome RuvABC endonuclease subunit